MVFQDLDITGDAPQACFWYNRAVQKEQKPIPTPESEIFNRFAKLPPDITGVVNAPESIATMQRLDATYPTLNSAGTIIRIVTGVVPLAQLKDYLVNEQGVAPEAVPSLQASMEGLLRPILPKLQSGAPPTAATPPPPTVPPAPTPPPPPKVPIVTPPAVPSVPLVTPPPPPVVPPAPAIPPAPITLPSHGFESQDEAAEIAKHREAVQAMENKPQPDPTAVADRIAKDFSLSFPDSNLQGRFHTIAISAMKGIRKPYDTRDLLSRSTKIGGLGLSPEVTEKLITAFAAHAGELGASSASSAPALSTPGTAPTPIIPGSRSRPPLPTAPSIPLRSAPARSVVASAPPVAPANLPVPSAPSIAPSLPPVQPFVIPTTPRLVATTPTPAAQPVPFAAVVDRPRPIGRAVVADVRKPKRTVGPVDELGLLTVDDLRRLDRDPEVALTKVWGKFQSLKKESFSLYAEGMKAWRRSPLYRLYVTMGTDSMSSGRAVDEVANARRMSNQPTLTPKEFAMIADFNRNLRL